MFKEPWRGTHRIAAISYEVDGLEEIRRTRMIGDAKRLLKTLLGRGNALLINGAIFRVDAGY